MKNNPVSTIAALAPRQIYQYTSILVVGILGTVFPLMVNANGGMQKVAEGKYIVNVSSAPIAPYAGETQKLLIGFADIEGELIEEDISVDLTLKQGSQTLVERRNLIAQSGVLPFSHTYDAPGIYELFVKFRLPADPDHVFEPEDFLIEVKGRGSADLSTIALSFIGGFLTALLLHSLGKRA